MADSIEEIKNVKRIVPIVSHKEKEELKFCKSHLSLPEGFIPIKVNMIKSDEDYEKCIKCEDKITISTSIMTRKQIIKNEITDKIKSEKSLNNPVIQIEELGNIHTKRGEQPQSVCHQIPEKKKIEKKDIGKNLKVQYVYFRRSDIDKTVIMQTDD